MASIRSKQRGDGTWAHRVYFRYADGTQSCYTFDTEQMAEAFKAAVNQLGAEKAIALHRLERQQRASGEAMTVAEWVKHYIDHLTGIDRRTIADYRGILRKDITPSMGAIPLTELSRDDVGRWVQGMELAGSSGKTIANKHGGLLSPALAAAVEAGHIPSNPASRTRLPTSVRMEMVFLSHEQFNRLLAEIPEQWKPLTEFLVTSGARWSEATALYPGDVNRTHNTVRISRAWKRQPYRIGTTKTKRSNRTINVPPAVLDKLDYSGDYLFTNPGHGNRGAGGPVRAPNFRANVWWPATARAKLIPRPRIHDLRHTCASWLIAAGMPLPVIQAHLGHESIKTTVDMYGHLDRRSFQAVSDVMDKLLAGPSESSIPD
ncbi:tyrosine-type recombinase/integrase [Mycobacterium sp. 23]|uniref:tyrosine-type recombinase/integrase n=1 Tax=Mycobacterium sp. 23 TaxID=3400424 RepID=UPI003AAE7F8E